MATPVTLSPVLTEVRQNLLPVEECHSTVDAAIDEGWVTVGAPLEFSEPVVSRVMDGV